MSGGTDARRNTERNVLQRRDEYIVSPIHLAEWCSEAGRINSRCSLRAVKRIQKTFFFEPLTLVLEHFNAMV